MKLLLHACCAPCSSGVIPVLRGENIAPDLFWYNPNIHPYTEYRARRDCLAGFAEEEKFVLLVDDVYDVKAFVADALSEGDSRCEYCYRLRLEKTAKKAKDAGYDAFSTTLLISPYQNHDVLKKTGEDFAARYGVEFFYRDFRPAFYEGKKTARARGYYMQKYCGCIFSREERGLGTGDRGSGTGNCAKTSHRGTENTEKDGEFTNYNHKT